MSGHSKWSNTKYRKTAQDNKRGKIFSKIISELVTATKIGGSDMERNPRLRTVVNKALSNNMTRDVIYRAIYRVEGNNNININKVTYEGYGPGGTAMIINCLSDNKNRTVSEIRYALVKYGGNLGINGSVSYLFITKGIISCMDKKNEDTMENIAVEAGADDICYHENGVIDIYTTENLLRKICCKLKNSGINIISSKLTYIPSVYVDLNESNSSKLIDLIKFLKKYNDVKNIFHNAKLYIND